MNWKQAIQSMREGATVRRVSESVRTLTHLSSGMAVYESGEEGCRLAYAYTPEGESVRVFQGESGCLFVPTTEQVLADDWVVTHA